ncbi:MULTISPECIES: hypothetical protein [unclassified Adlercreutzia]|uniref:hypothetical protein n=1 Tax=unclassified Adlercreutzia TaxID=2636013 RepID=UPI0013EAF87D|nr:MULTISPECIES: hypothetical protein [unclassified Adlercreutzia]
MATYIAHYRSLNSAAEHISGLFEFESSARLGTKANAHDARMHMLEDFGNTALSWNIYKIDRKRGDSQQINGQQELDFRKPTRRRKTDTKRGCV